MKNKTQYRLGRLCFCISACMFVVGAGPLENVIEELYYTYILYERKKAKTTEKKNRKKQGRKKK